MADPKGFMTTPREVAARVVVKGMQRHARANEWRGGRQEASCIADMAGLR